MAHRDTDGVIANLDHLGAPSGSASEGGRSKTRPRRNRIKFFPRDQVACPALKPYVRAAPWQDCLDHRGETSNCHVPHGAGHHRRTWRQVQVRHGIQSHSRDVHRNSYFVARARATTIRRDQGGTDWVPIGAASGDAKLQPGEFSGLSDDQRR